MNVVYGNLTIKYHNNSQIANSLELILNEHDTEKLYANVADSFSNPIENASILWSSSDPSIVTVDNNGTIKGIKSGTAIITATAAGVTNSCEVKVVNAPTFTDFSNAKYELLLDRDYELLLDSDYAVLKITGVSPQDYLTHQYFCIIASDKNEPSFYQTDEYGAFFKVNENTVSLWEKKDKTCMYSSQILKDNLDLDKDIYLWIVEQVRLDASYLDEEDHLIQYSTKVVAREKIEKTSSSSENSKKEENKTTTNTTPKEETKTTNTTDKKDNTTAPGKIPYTGGATFIIISLIGIVAVGIYVYKRNNDLKGI